MHRTIRCTSNVNHPYIQVRDTLLANPRYVFRHATAAAAIGDATLHITVGGFELGTDVAIEVTGTEVDPAYDPPATKLNLSWSAVKHRDLFPTMYATLTIYALSPTETELAFAGHCHRPASRVGRIIFAAVGRRVVQSSVDQFVQAVAGWLREELLFPLVPPTMHSQQVSTIPPDREC